MSGAKTKFQELLDQLSQKPTESVPSSPKSINKPEYSIKSFLDGLAEAKSKLSVAEKITKNPKLTSEMYSENLSALESMPSNEVTDNSSWLVQVYPDTGSILHFQARCKSSKAYTKWYEVVKTSVYAAVKAVYSNSAYEERRGSFFSDSSKEYLICSRSGESEVLIPSYGSYTVPQLFGLPAANVAEVPSETDLSVVSEVEEDNPEGDNDWNDDTNEIELDDDPFGGDDDVYESDIDDGGNHEPNEGNA